MQVCSNCGKYVEQLDEVTGWCDDCTPASSVADQVSHYLEVNADKIEYYIVEGYAKTVYDAIDLLADPKNGHRPNCVVCGSVIRHAPKNSIFCRRTKECRKYSRRYVYLYTKKGMTKAEALATVLGQVA